MVPNPFIELAQDPVGTLALLGYALLMLAILVVGVPWVIRQWAILANRWQNNRHGPQWWSFGDRSAGYVPPGDWIGRLFVTILVLAVATWALGTLVWVIS